MKPAQWAVVASIVVIATTAIAFFVFRPRTSIVPVMIVTRDDCPDVRIGNETARAFFQRAVDSRQLRRALNKNESDFIVSYLAAAIAGCEDEIGRLRGGTLNPTVLRTARRAAENFDPQWRPPEEALESPERLAIWWLELAQPWAWVDRSSLVIDLVHWDQLEQDRVAFFEEWAKRRADVVALPPTMYESAFGTFTPPSEEALDAARLIRARITFGIREETHPDVPLVLTVYFWLREDNDPLVVAIMLRGNQGALWRNLAL